MQPMSTAPRDGRNVNVCWVDFDGQENQSIARYRSLAQLKKAGGDWSDADEGWWTFVDGNTLKKIEPYSWIEPGADDQDE